MAGLLDYLSDKYHTENIKEINRRLIELSSVFEISQILNSSIELNQVLNNILLIPMGRLMLSKGIIFLKDQGKLLPKLWKGLPDNIAEKPLQLSDLAPEIGIIETNGDKIANLNADVDHFEKNQLALIVPVRSQEKLIGIIVYGAKLNKKPFSAEEKDFLSSLANLSATAIENALQVEEIKNVNQQLDERIHQLKTLFDIAQGLSATLESEKIVKLLSYALMGQMLVYHYAIVVFGEEGLLKFDGKGFSQDTLESLIETEPDLSKIDSPILIDKLNNKKLSEKLLKMGARVIIPMLHQNKFLGFILLGEKINKQHYSEVDLEFLATIVSQAIISLENARLFIETIEKQRIEQELQVAKSIQKKLLPREIVQIQGYDTWGINNSSKEVGGDYFDIIPISSQRFALAIGDVSGKSVPAALIMANLQAGLRTIISENPHLDQVVGKLNTLIYHNTDLDKYITFFIGVLDSESHEFTYVNAGHNPPMFIDSKNKFHLLEEGGIILGMMPDYVYKLGKIKFKSNDLLLCYTDGVNEALNLEEQEFGEKRLQDLIIKHRQLDSRPLSDKIIEEIYHFCEGAPQYDDITLLITKRLT
jgi:sigma-B regulation protein RsbU (phosphoserine phosphatase)